MTYDASPPLPCSQTEAGAEADAGGFATAEVGPGEGETPGAAVLVGQGKGEGSRELRRSLGPRFADEGEPACQADFHSPVRLEILPRDAVADRGIHDTSVEDDGVWANRLSRAAGQLFAQRQEIDPRVGVTEAEDREAGGYRRPAAAL